MKIIEYEEKYLEDVRDLLVELGEYIVSIDEDELEQVHPEYRKKMTQIDLEKVNKQDGKCYLALDNNRVIGLIMGIVTMSIFSVSGDALIHSFLLDEELNKGQPKAFPELQKFMSDER